MQAPQKITYHKRSKNLEVAFDDWNCSIPAELLRVYSPSAEVRGHSDEQRVLQTGKKYVGISTIEPVGNYAIRIGFDDGHDSGIFAWDYLAELGRNQKQLWSAYITELKVANASRLPTIPVGHWTPRD
ncbi:MAG: gamma-butyrobetaine hydroxylase-like domain-containing protein [Pseudomonadales bacterium]